MCWNFSAVGKFKAIERAMAEQHELENNEQQVRDSAFAVIRGILWSDQDRVFSVDALGIGNEMGTDTVKIDVHPVYHWVE